MPPRRWRRFAVAIAALCGSAGTQVALSTPAGAATSAVSISSTSYVAADTAAIWTVTFTAATAFGHGDYVDVNFPDSFDLTSAVATLGTGFTGCTAGTIVPKATSGSPAWDVAQIPLNGTCAATTGSPDTLTITGINPTVPGQIGSAAFGVDTYSGLGSTGPLDGSESGVTSPLCETTSPYTGNQCDILASVTYSNLTSQGTATNGGSAPIDSSSPYSTSSVFSPPVSVLGNTAGLTLAGYAFAGWCTTANNADPTVCSSGTAYTSGSSFTIASNTTLYSMWTLSPPAADGSGTNVVSPTTSVGAFPDASSYTFTYTAATGGMSGGEVDIIVPSGWSTPSSSASAGCTTVLGGGTLSFVGQTIKVSALSLAGGASLTVTYGATSGGNCVASDGALPRGATSTFATSEKSTAGGTLTSIASSPQVTVTLSCPSGFSGINCDVPVTHPLPPLCPPGQYLNGANCNACPLGTYTTSSNRGASCDAAPAGSYVSGTGATGATPCAAGSFSSGSGATVCTEAPAGTYVESTGASSAIACPAGTTTPPNALGSIAVSACSVINPLIASGNSKSVSIGRAFQFVVKATGSPLPTISESGPLPHGVTFRANGAGSAQLLGVPVAGTSGEYILTFTAKNSFESATQTFKLSVLAGPNFTSSDAVTTEAAGPANLAIAPLSFAVKTSGYPLATITTTSPLPIGVSLVGNQDGTATLEGTPAAGSGGQYPITLVARNALGTTSQTFTLTVPSIDVYSIESQGLCVGDGSKTLLNCPVSGIPSRSIGFVCNVKHCSGPQLTDSYCPQGSVSPRLLTAGMTGTISNCAVPSTKTTSGGVDQVRLDFHQGGKSQTGPSLQWRAKAAAPVLSPVITSLDSSTCLGRTLSGTTTVGFTACPSKGASILINGKNFFYTTTVTPGLCSSLFYVTFFQLLCLLAPMPPGTVTNVQASTPGMGQSRPTGFSVQALGVPAITSLQDTVCTGTSHGLALSGCPSTGGSTLVVKVNGTALPSATLTAGLCSNVLWIDLNTLSCTLSSGTAPGTTLNVVIAQDSGTSTNTATISF